MQFFSTFVSAIGKACPAHYHTPRRSKSAELQVAAFFASGKNKGDDDMQFSTFAPAIGKACCSTCNNEVHEATCNSALGLW